LIRSLSENKEALRIMNRENIEGGRESAAAMAATVSGTGRYANGMACLF